MNARNQEPETRNKGFKSGSHGPEPKGFRSLIAWQKTDELASAVYRTLGKVPAAQRWLAVQAMRAAISVPANIAEGYGRGALGDYIRFLDIARGSLAELEYYLHFIRREGIIADGEAASLEGLHQETGKILYGLWKSLKQKVRDGTWDRSGLIHDESGDYSIGAAVLEEHFAQ